MWRMVDRQTQHCSSKSWKVWALTQGVGEHHDQPHSTDDAVVLDDKSRSRRSCWCGNACWVCCPSVRQGHVHSRQTWCRHYWFWCWLQSSEDVAAGKGDPKQMNSVLSGFSWRRCAAHQRSTDDMQASSSRKHAPSDWRVALASICVLSAYKWWDIGIMSLMSSVYAVHWEGPTMEPCGMPHIRLVDTDTQRDRAESCQSHSIVTPKLSSSWVSSVECSTISMRPTSRGQREVCSDICQWSFMILSSAVSVEQCFWLAEWNLSNLPTQVICGRSHANSRLSMIFDIVFRLDIDL